MHGRSPDPNEVAAELVANELAVPADPQLAELVAACARQVFDP
jgi:hypothetical protein